MGYVHLGRIVSLNLFSRAFYRTGFLSIPPHGGPPCLRLVVPLIRVYRDLSPPRFAPCRAHQKKGSLLGALRTISADEPREVSRHCARKRQGKVGRNPDPHHSLMSFPRNSVSSKPRRKTGAAKNTRHFLDHIKWTMNGSYKTLTPSEPTVPSLRALRAPRTLDCSHGLTAMA
jgi:hypothetical protein